MPDEVVTETTVVETTETPFAGDGDFSSGWKVADEAVTGSKPTETNAAKAEVEEPTESTDGEGEAKADPDPEVIEKEDSPTTKVPDEPAGKSDPPSTKSADKEVDPIETVKLELETLKTERLKERNDLKAEIGRLKKTPVEPTGAKKIEAKPGSEKAVDIDALFAPVKDLEPEIADPLKKAFKAVLDELKQVKDGQGRLDQQAKAQSGVREVEDVHPGGTNLLKSAEFDTWFADQPKYVQEAIRATDDPQDLVQLISQYKADTAKPEEKKAAEVAANADEDSTKEKRAREVRKNSSVGVPTKKSSTTPVGKVNTEEGFSSGWARAGRELSKG